MRCRLGARLFSGRSTDYGSPDVWTRTVGDPASLALNSPQSSYLRNGAREPTMLNVPLNGAAQFYRATC